MIRTTIVRAGDSKVLTQVNYGDIIALRSTGAYGEVMSSQYNLRDKAKDHFDLEVK